MKTLRIQSKINGPGKVICGPDDFFILAPSAKLDLNHDLRLNSGSFGRNRRSSLLRVDREACVKVNGRFDFYYGADIQVFQGGCLNLGNSYINSNCKIRCKREITIGDDCAISHDFTVMDSNFHPIDGKDGTKPVHIGNHVWIGTRVTILSGVHVGDGAVIAAGSIVKHDVPPRCMAAGVPAKVIKEDVTWEH